MLREGVGFFAPMLLYLFLKITNKSETIFFLNYARDLIIYHTVVVWWTISKNPNIYIYIYWRWLNIFHILSPRDYEHSLSLYAHYFLNVLWKWKVHNTTQWYLHLFPLVLCGKIPKFFKWHATYHIVVTLRRCKYIYIFIAYIYNPVFVRVTSLPYQRSLKYGNSPPFYSLDIHM